MLIVIELIRFKKSIDINNDQKNISNNSITYSNQINDLSKCNIYIITVPTPVNSGKHSRFIFF